MHGPGSTGSSGSGALGMGGGAILHVPTLALALNTSRTVGGLLQVQYAAGQLQQAAAQQAQLMASAPAVLLLDVSHGPAALALSAPLAGLLPGLSAPAAVQHVLAGGASGSAVQQGPLQLQLAGPSSGCASATATTCIAGAPHVMHASPHLHHHGSA